MFCVVAGGNGVCEGLGILVGFFVGVSLVFVGRGILVFEGINVGGI